MKKFVFLYYYYVERIKSKDRIEFPPLGMLYVCSAIEVLGFEVEVLYFTEKTDVSEIPQADVYLYSISSTASYKFYLALAEKMKLYRPNSIYVAGNTHANVFPEQVLNELRADVVFCGESEHAMQQWILSGMIYRGVIYCKRQNNIDSFYPARHLLSDDKIYMSGRIGGKSKHSISMLSSRGCVYQCQFCAIQNRGGVSYRSKQSFDKEIMQILKSYPKCDGITLLDETFTMNKKHVFDIIDVLGKYDMLFECNSRIDTLCEQVVDALAKSTCQEVRIGLESGSQELLNKMAKGINLQDAKRVFSSLQDHGINVKIYLMHGYPGENRQTTLQTINYLSEICSFINRVSLYRFTPLPGSPIYNTNLVKKRKWEEYTIYDNNVHWWGNEKDYKEMCESYIMLEKFIEKLELGNEDKEK